MTDPPVTVVEQEVYTGRLGWMPYNNPGPPCHCLTAAVMASRPPKQGQACSQVKQTQQCDRHSLGTLGHQEGWGWVLALRKPYWGEGDEVRLREGLGFILGLVSQDLLVIQVHLWHAILWPLPPVCRDHRWAPLNLA